MMGAMDIDSRTEFPADPERVFAMLTDKAFLEKVCAETHARSYDVIVDGSSVKTSRELPSPDAARPFTGETLTVVEDISWSGAGDGGARTGLVKMTVPSQPVNFNGKYELAAGGAGTILTLKGQLKVNVPLLGKKLEQAAAPAVMAAFQTQQQVGAGWLAG
jgi:uncharacterized protein YndB with AHSA1/START domain